MSNELREKIAALFDLCRSGGTYSNSDEFAGFVLALPEIREALRAAETVNGLAPFRITPLAGDNVGE